MMTFKVETFVGNTNDWEGAISFKPEYIWSTMKMRIRLLPWPKWKEIGVIANLRDAEKDARALALVQAKVLNKKKQTRVMQVTELGGKAVKMTIWQNGKLLDPKLWPWWYRFYRWCRS